jgi:filamentous hemagglutinin family protein
MISCQFKLRYLKISVLLYLLASAPTVAQIVPDTTLPVNSVVKPQDSTNLIEGGTKAGSNLFHSFSKFDIPTGSTAFFNNAADITNIFSRITGKSASNIDGILQTNGTANLFIINPNGINFGTNAQLNIGGSFVATTANAIVFGNQGFFSASVPNNPQLLTVLPSSFLFNQITARPISSEASLQVATGQNLLLVGGNVSLNGGQLLAPGGRVELGGLAQNGTVGLNQDGNNLNLNFPLGEIPRADVGLSNGSVVNVRAGGGGSIAINAHNFNLAGESRLRAGIASDMGSAQSQGGNIEINATQAITLDDGSTISNLVLEGGVGNGGNINLTAGSLSFTNGAALIASTRGQGNAGSVTIVAKDAVTLDSSDISSDVDEGAIGNGGNINITTGSLSLTNSAQLSSSTLGEGNAGSVTIVAKNAMSLDGTLFDGYSSAVYSSVEQGAIGHGGNINLTTGSLSLTNGAALTASTLGEGNAGSVTIVAKDAVSLNHSAVFSRVEAGAVGNGGNVNLSTGSLSLTNGADLTASTLGEGNAGSVTIIAKDAVSLDGTFSNGDPSGVFSRVAPGAIGYGGNINISTDSLSLTNSAQVNAKSEGTGDAGNITNITARYLNIDNASITTGSISGNGGNIENLQVNDLRLRNHSQISTTAGTAETGLGNGGNIKFNLDTLVLLENSQISANAFEGRGGNIQINTQGLFQSLDSQITASSQLGLNGEVKVNTPGIDPSKGLTDLPEKVTDVSQLVAQNCTSEQTSSSSSLTITGRGGLPSNPIQSLTGETVLIDLATSSIPITKSPEITRQNLSIKTQPQLIEATRWSLNSKGEVLLVASASHVTPHLPWQSSPSCNGNG